MNHNKSVVINARVALVPKQKDKDSCLFGSWKNVTVALPKNMCQHKGKFVRHAKQAITVNFMRTCPHAKVNASTVRYGCGHKKLALS